MKTRKYFQSLCYLIASMFVFASSVSANGALYIYKDADFSKNIFTPSGYMGDVGDIVINQTYSKSCVEGTCIQVVYTAKRKGPNECNYNPPCKWAGVVWQHPPNNWGNDKKWKGKGFDLSGYQRLVFSARSEKPAIVKFEVGGNKRPYGDSLKEARGEEKSLTPEWQTYVIDLKDADLSHIISGFVWASNQKVTFYLDNIRFEK